MQSRRWCLDVLEDFFVGIRMSNFKDVFKEHFLKTTERKKKSFLIFARETIEIFDNKF